MGLGVICYSNFNTQQRIMFIDNYYNNRQHYKEYLLWLYFRVVKTKINGKAVMPASLAFIDDRMELWSKEGIFIVCMGLSSKGKEYYSSSPYYEIIQNNEMDEVKIRDMYNDFKNQKLK